MKKIADFIARRNILILIVGLLLMIPAIYGFLNTKINYDILVYLPEDIETIQGEKILEENFGLGAFAFVITDVKDSQKVLELEEKIKKINGVGEVLSMQDALGTTIPYEMLPSEIKEFLYEDDQSIVFVTFNGSASERITVDAVSELRKVVGDANKVSSMTALVLDTRSTADEEMLAYIIIAVILCSVILLVATDSYVVPIFLLGNIGIAILYNMGTNVFLGEISYITKAISAVLQLGVTTDFSIFLYHKYEQAKKEEKDKRKAMSKAIQETFKSVVGSSLTTFAGFLALCTMDLTLGTDIGLVMAKGVLFGLLTVLTIFPASLLTFDKLIEKTKHKNIFPTFKGIRNFEIKHYKVIAIVFLILLIPAYIGNKNYDVYYKLDESLPDYLPFKVANKELAEKFNIISPSMIILKNDVKKNDVEEMAKEIKELDGISFVLSPTTLASNEMIDLIPEEYRNLLVDEDYQLIVLNSTYEIASDELNAQLDKINKIVKKYNKDTIVAGEGALMKDLVTIADHDFHMVNYTSIAVVFVIMVLVLQSIILPILLIFVIEFAIFTNMSFAYYMGSSLPFIASIVVGTIQLGATIDYAILMSTRYLEEREKSEKMKAMQETLKYTVPSIITSGLCFFAATVGVSIYTNIDMIGSICTLLARGSIISMLVVILILPSLLIICDKAIIKFTRVKKEGKNMKKIKKVVAILIITIICLNPLNTFAKTKVETIYSILKNDGSIQKTTINTELRDIEKGDIVDYTKLDSIKNINGREKFSRGKEELVWKSTGKDIFYQGKLNDELPINVTTTYYLNDKVSTPSKMKNKKGNVKVIFKFKNKDYNANESLYVPYLVNTTTILDNKNNSNIKITNGKVVSTGNKTLATALTSPGLYENTDIEEFKDFDTVEITYNTSKFENIDFYFVITPKLLDKIDIEKLNEVDKMTSSLKTLQDGMNQVENGSKQLAMGNKELTKKTQEFSSNLGRVSVGMNTLNTGVQQVRSAVNDVNQTVTIINDALNSINESSITITKEQYNLLPESVRETLARMIGLYKANEDIMISLKELNASLEATYNLYGLSQDEATIRAQLIATNTDEKTIELLINTKHVYEIKYTTNKELINKLNDSLKELLVGENGILKTVMYYMTKINDGANQLADGANTINGGLKELYGGSIRLVNAIDKVADSTTTLSDGITKINETGIKKISSLGNQVNDYTNKTKKLINLINNYNGFACNDADETIFIYKMEG